MTASDWSRLLVLLVIAAEAGLLGAYLARLVYRPQLAALRASLDALRQKEMGATHTSIDITEFLAKRARKMKRAS